jgi:hypothetical protein
MSQSGIILISIRSSAVSIDASDISAGNIAAVFAGILKISKYMIFKNGGFMKKITALLMLVAISAFFSAQVSAEDEKTGLLLETIGVLSGHGIYLTYVSVGTLADGYAKKTYKNDFAAKLMQEYIQLSNVSKNQLIKLSGSSALSADDLGYIKRLISTYSLLIEEAQGYKEFITTGDKKYLKIYSDKREEAWKMISGLLNIK